ncbi:cholinesterase-like [Aricia agestis]|uniref:cholinesterase-like n=1 Tax=Aricia agestis TaxID=91739 RepID=UPI001C204719|nr:cholinesterase-like [Aricia agestis]
MWRCCVFALLTVRSAGSSVVQTKVGLIRGVLADDGDYSMYLGIPYADVNETTPFADSTPHPPFQGIYDASNDSAKCPQRDNFSQNIEGTLDCLRLHVYVPNIQNNRTLPVLVWIHGGVFKRENGGRFVYGPKFLVKHGVILVSLNYRLGPYGFLCLGTPEAPGNQGLKDQLLALRWIKRNIQAFGGDPDRITVMGESAGAISVELHILSKFEKLFDAAIIQSGSVNAPGAITTVEANVEKALKLSEKLGYERNNLDDIIKFLAKMNPLELIDVSLKLNTKYIPCIERNLTTAFITEHPKDSQISPDKVVPILGGFNSKEELVTYTDQPQTFLTERFFRNFLELSFEVNDEMVETVHKFYLGEAEISEAVKSNLIDFLSDFKSCYHVQNSLLNFLNNGADVYQYLFSYNGTRNYLKNISNVTDYGAAHADEIGYIFDLSYDKHATEDDQLMIDRITTLWTNFVKYRKPVPKPSDLIPVDWVPLSEPERFYLDMDVDLALKTKPFETRLAFWDSFFEIYEDRELF